MNQVPVMAGDTIHCFLPLERHPAFRGSARTSQSIRRLFSRIRKWSYGHVLPTSK
jgi:hypothetical protein